MHSEKQIEQYLVKSIKQIGGMCIKMVPTYENGIPDRQVLYQGKSVFVELKAPGKKAAQLQVEYMKELEKAGFRTIVIDSKAGVDDFIHSLISKPKSTNSAYKI